jgi:hypothetical protein
MGNCISLGRPYLPFMQGGSGYLMSRRAVERLTPFSRYFVLHSAHEEDQYIGRFLLTMLNVTASEMTSHRFIGYQFTANETEALLNNDFSKFPPCPSWQKFSRNPGGCSWFVKPIREVIFFHQSLSDISEDVIRLARAVFNAPPYIMFWMMQDIPNLCRNVTI